MKVYQNKNSMDYKMIKYIAFLILPILFMLIISNVYAISVVRKQVRESSEGTVELYMNSIDQSLSDLERYLANYASNMNLNYPVNINDDSMIKFRRQQGINTDLEEALRIYNNSSGFFSYNELNGEYIGYFNDYMNVIDKIALREYVQEAISDEKINKHTTWFIGSIKNETYFLRVFLVEDYFIGTVINTSELMQSIRDSEFAKDKFMFFKYNNELLLKNDDYTTRYKDNISKKFLEISHFSKYIGIEMIALLEGTTILEGLDQLLMVIIFMSIFSILFIPVILLFLRKTFVYPIMNIVKAMEKVKKGDLDERLNEKVHFEELKIVNESFNEMIGQIEYLKIEVYEEQIERRDIELQYLELQINPHFFLNALNIIYNMAEMESYDLVKDMSIYLVNHFRYILKSKGKLMTIDEELEHIENYLRIQEIRYDNQFTYDIDIEPALYNLKIPALTIQTFVENSIKYAINMDEIVHVQVKVYKNDSNPDNEFIIEVSDTGNGFPEAVLEEINKFKIYEDHDGEHYGIYNVIQRLKLIYGDKSSISITNNQGAHIILNVPRVKEEKKYENYHS